MPSFLSKVFTRKKDEKDASHPPKRTSVASLLEGKFEAVSPPASPSATNVAHAQHSPKEERKEKEKDVGFSLFRTRSPRPTSLKTDTAKSQLPHLTLNLPEEKSNHGPQLVSVFEADAGERAVLPDNVTGERRLNPSEALKLVKACSTAIVDRGGLETLGVMHPHWYSASPDVQRRLISLFILSLASNSPSTLPPSPNSPSTLFDTELEYTRSPHDLAAVLRWALRHLRLEGDFFGLGSSSAEPWQWYKTFSDAERAASYPSGAFSQFLTPQLPPAHLHLLEATLEIVSSLASHSDRSGVSGSKLSKLFGLWLLTTRRAEDGDDWSTFYARWERAGRILEHLPLAQIRDEKTRTKIPRRLAELVAGYPYLTTSEPEDDLLPRPRLSTRTYDALYVRVETQLPDFTVSKHKQPPLHIIADAVKAQGAAQAGEHDSLWELLKQQAAATEKTALAPEDDTAPTLSRVFTDETTRLFSMLPSEGSKTETTAVQLEVPEPRGRSRSVGAGQNGTVTNGATRATMSTTDLSPKDWTDFSSLGFGESALGKDFASTLMDNDVEVTEPPLGRRKSSRRQKASPSRRAQPDAPSTSRTGALPSTCAPISIVHIDEAFIDFWSDALLDPIASNWPSFVICQLKPVAGLRANGKPLSWLVIEQVFTRPPPPPEPESPVVHRAASPKPSLRSNISSRRSATLSNAKKRFTLFSSKETIGSLDAKLAARKRASKTPNIGEMGEILPEEPENPPTVPQKAEADVKGAESAGTEVATGVAVAAAATAGTVVAADSAKVNADLPPVPIIEAEAPAAEAATSVTAVKSDEEPAEKPTKFVEHITPPTSTSPASSEHGGDQDVSDPKELPPAPEPVVLAGETPGPDVALRTSEPVALAETSAHAESAPAEPSAPEKPTVTEEAQPVPEPLEPAARASDVVVSETVEPAPQEVEVPAVPEIEAKAPAEPTGVTVVEHSAPVAEPISEVPTEEEPVAKPMLAAEEPVAEPTTAEVAVAGDEPEATQDLVQPTEELASQQEPTNSSEPGPAAAAPEEKEPVVEDDAPVVTEEGVPATPDVAEQEELSCAPPVSTQEPVVEQNVQAADEPQNGSAHNDKTDDTASPDAAA